MKIGLIMMLCVLVVSMGKAQVPTSGLVAEYLFSNGSYDDTNPNGYGPNNAFGTIGVQNVVDRFGNPSCAKDLAGIHAFLSNKSFISLGTSSVLKPQVGSISIWVNLDQISTSGWGYAYNPIILATNPNAPGAYMEGYAMYVRMSDRKLLTITTEPPTNEQYFFTNQVPLDSWHHYVMTYDNNTLQLYVDGVLVATKAKNFASVFSSESVRIGSSLNWSNNRALDGIVDDLRIYNRVLSASEVLNLYQEVDPFPSYPYAELKSKLDAGATLLQDNTLRFKFNQEYQTTSSNTNISYTIHDWTRGTPISTGSFSTQHGLNWVEVNLPSGLNALEYYTLELEANKGQKYYLRFKPKQP